MRNHLIRQLLRLVFDAASQLIKTHNYLQRKRARRIWEKIPLTDKAPSPYEDQISDLESAFKKMPNAKWVYTSGTRNRPKKIPFDKKRLKKLTKTFLTSMITLNCHLKGKKTFFAFSSLDEDKSLTASMTEEGKAPKFYELLQAPYRFLGTPSGKEVRQAVGDLTAKIILILVTKPRIIYATNPSTLTHFVSQIETDWSEIQNKVRHFMESPLLDTVLELEDGAGRESLKLFLNTPNPDAKIILSELQAMVTWNGGYVASFVERLQKKFPNVEHIPMFSMSTETLETVPHKIGNQTVYLPALQGVRPEFQDQEGRTLSPFDLKIGNTYTLIVSDSWGLKRYDTQDLFEVVGIYDGLPDLRFKRRRNVTASMTGEKFTEEQALLVITELKQKFPHFNQASFIFYPVLSEHQAGYTLGIIDGEGPIDELAESAEKNLSHLNSEYASKVQSGRLLPITCEHTTIIKLAEMFNQKQFWESQFKVMPLYERPVRKNS